MIATAYFEDAGYDVLDAENGAQALEILRTRPGVTALVTDVQMPGEPGGIRLSHNVRRAYPCCAIVVVSGGPRPKEGVLASGARYVAKPSTGDEIVAVVEEILSA